MTEHTTDEQRATDVDDAWAGLTSEVVDPQDEPARCTIYPRDVDPGLALTTWVLARDDAFVELEDMR